MTGIPNYPEGNFYPGYKLKKKIEFIDNVKIIRLPIIPRKKGNIMLMFNYLSFVISGYLWATFTKEKYEKVFVYQLSPIFQVIPGIRYAKKNKVKIDMYVLDVWPESFFAITGIKNKYFIKLMNRISQRIYCNVDKILISSPGFEKVIIDKNISKQKIVYLPQFCEDIYLKEESTSEIEILNKEKCNITFAGNIGKAQGLNILLEVSKILKEKNSNIVFNLIGDGSYKEELKKETNLLGVSHFFNFIDSVSPEKAVEYLHATDFAFVSLMDDDLINLTIPAKVQSIMATGAPMIISGGKILEKIVNESQSGLWSYSGDAESLVKNLIYAESLSVIDKKAFSDNGKQYYMEHFDKDIIMKKLKENLEE